MSVMEGTLLHLATQAGLVLAQDAETTSSDGSLLTLLFPFLLLGGLFYILLFRPQRKRQQQLAQLRSALEVGDQVRTIGGIYGRVDAITDADVIIDVGNGTTLRVASQAIAARIGVDDE